MEILRALWPGRGTSGRRRRAERPNRSRRAPRLEGLEGRALLSTFTGPGSHALSPDLSSYAGRADVITFAFQQTSLVSSATSGAGAGRCLVPAV